MKGGTPVARSSRGATTAAARGRRGRRESDGIPATLALRREQHPDFSDYPIGAQNTRGSHYCLWSSSPFPRLLTDELVAPTSLLHRVDRPPMRPIPQAACHALRHRSLRAPNRRQAAAFRRKRRFLFQECIAAKVWHTSRSLRFMTQSRD